MDPKETKNTVDTSVPKPPADHLNESQKKSLELSGEIEHAQGPEQVELQKAVQELKKTSTGNS